MDGWIKVHRALMQNWIYQSDDPFCPRSAWLDMLLLANHSENKFRHGTEIITVPRGCFVSSVAKLAARWKWSRGKVERFVTCLEHEQMVSRQADSQRTCFSIRNYEQYQGFDDSEESSADRPRSRQRSRSRTGDRQAADTNKKYTSTFIDPSMGFSLPFNTQPEDPPSTEQDPPPEEPDAGLLTFRHPETGYTRTTKRIRMTQDERHDIESEFGADLFSRELGSMDDWLVSKGTSKKNYPAFCRNWLRRALKERAATKNGKAPQQSAASLFAAIAAEESSREGNHD